MPEGRTVRRTACASSGRAGTVVRPLVLLLVLLSGCARPPAPARFPGYTEDVILYTVQPGETLYDVAERNYGQRSLAWSLAIVNELSDPGRVPTGINVFIPNDHRILVSMAEGRRRSKRPFNRGTYLLELGREREAIVQLEKALAESPAVVAPRYHLGLAYLRAGRTAEAVQELEEVVRRRPLDRDFRYALGCAYLERGSSGDAGREFEQAARFDAGFAPARFGAALALQMAGKRKDAAKAWRAYLEMDPEGEWAERASAHLTDLYAGD